MSLTLSSSCCVNTSKCCSCSHGPRGSIAPLAADQGPGLGRVETVATAITTYSFLFMVERATYNAQAKGCCAFQARPFLGSYRTATTERVTAHILGDFCKGQWLVCLCSSLGHHAAHNRHCTLAACGLLAGDLSSFANHATKQISIWQLCCISRLPATQIARQS